MVKLSALGYWRKLLFLPFLLILSICGKSQNQCPPNIDFESGDFTNWDCKTGNANYSLANVCPAVPGGSNIINLSNTAPIPGRHTIIPSSNTGIDLYGRFPVSCPNGSQYSLKLGNEVTGQNKADGISYTYAIPASVSNFSILYQYAVVLNDPNNGCIHQDGQKPRFKATVTSVTTGQEISCVSFDFISGALPGFLLSSQTAPGGTAVYYKEWTPISLNLSSYAGQTINIEFKVSNCTLGGHFGYAYVDVNSVCNGAIVGTTICRGDTSVTLTAPYGFQFYEWYNNTSFSTVISTSQLLTLSPAPNAGAVYPVVVTPFPGFGCLDTLYATLTLADKPISYAGNNATVCKYEQVPLGGPPNPLYTYNWEPYFLVSDPAVANPTGYITTYDTMLFIVRTTDPATGCFSTDTALLTPRLVDTSIVMNGKDAYCANETILSNFSLNNAATNIQWYNGTNAIAGATSTPYIPSASGAYWARLTHNGCTDSTRQLLFTVNPKPDVTFTVPLDTGCVTKNSFAFANGTTITSTEGINYLWTFGDGTTSTTANPVKTYNSTGNFDIKLLATSGSGCKDSAFDEVTILPNVTAGFRWDSICLNRPAVFTNLSNENGSRQVSYAWDFGDSITSSARYPAPFNYQSRGTKNVSLTAVAVGCENDIQIVTKQAVVNYIAPGIKYPSLTIPFGYSREIWARDSVGVRFNWLPFNYLNSSRIKAPQFTAVNDVAYNITLTNEHECTTIDTLEIKVLNKKGWYLPNAFTPNGDNLNDNVRPYLIGMKGLKRFSIYNRAGNLIFTTTQDGKAWDGTYKGEKMGPQAFVWILEYYDASNKIMLEKGTLMLIRE